MKKELSASEQYAQLKAKQFDEFLQASFSDDALQNTELFEVKVPSGMRFKCRRLDQAFMSNTGLMPMALTETYIASQSDEGLDDKAKAAAQQARFQQMSEAEQRANIQATAGMVRYICVEPRIVVGDVGNQRNAISSEMLTVADFNYLSEWASGGEAAVGLKTFRKGKK